MGALGHQSAQGRNLLCLRNPIMDVGVETDLQLSARVRQGHESIPSLYAQFRPRTETHVPLSHPLSNRQFRGVVVER